MAEPSSPDDLLRRCTVRIKVGQVSGTGFFVAPGQILTCAHVVEPAQTTPALITVLWQETSYSSTVAEVLSKDYPDLALLTVDVVGHPCVFLGETISIGDNLYSFGYTDEYPHGDSADFVYEGPSYEPRLLHKLKLAQARPGLSGAALLNRQHNMVCGIVKSTRDRSTDLGARAVPTETILAEFPDLRLLQEQFHQKDLRWQTYIEQVHSPAWPTWATWRWLRKQIPLHWLIAGAIFSLVVLASTMLALYWSIIDFFPTPPPSTPQAVLPSPTTLSTERTALSMQPTAIPLMSDDLNIAVARFGRLASNGKVIDSVDASDLSEKVYSSLKTELELLRQEHSQTRYTIQVRGPSEIGAIKGATREEQAQEAEKLALAHNAHIVVYGNLDTDGTSFHLELYLAANRLRDAEEFVKEPEESVGQYDFGSKVEVADDITTNPIARQRLRDSVLKQVSGMAQFMLGLGHYHLDEFEQAEEFFQSAANNVVSTGSSNEQDEKAVFYLFLGNTALKANKLADAEKYYNQALAYSPGYARALLGGGAVLYEKSRAQCKAGKADGKGIQKAIDNYYKPALEARNKPIRSNITVKTAYYLGFAYLCLSQAQIVNKWDDAKVQLQFVVAEYEGGNDQIRERAAEAYAGLGFIALPFTNDPDAEAKFQSAAKMYGTALYTTRRPVLQAQYYTWLAYIHLRLAEYTNRSKECADASEALAKADAAFARIAQPNPSDQAFRQDVGRKFANASCAQDAPRN